jgi:hypothetical protein
MFLSPDNETFNTLKNQGYHIEHNYGHGEKNLSMMFFMLNFKFTRLFYSPDIRTHRPFISKMQVAF